MTRPSRQGTNGKKFHVALSFAGEERTYVEAVANKLRESDVTVFYDKFEAANLWGKNLYDYLSDVYQNHANYTVIFISSSYAQKMWTNHERQAAQARALTENLEYILPAVFDDSVSIPGIPKTIGYIDLRFLTPDEFADIIIKKLRDTGVLVSAEERFIYSSEATADVDFSLLETNEVNSIIKNLKTHDWYEQNPAIKEIFSLNWKELTSDQLFVLGRNIYQCACGRARNATDIVENVRRELAQVPLNSALDLLNGMFYEIYFNSKGEFRRTDLKADYLNHLFAAQTVEKYKESIGFIRQALSPYRKWIAVLPSTVPEIIEVKIRVSDENQSVLTSVKCMGKQLLVNIPADTEFLQSNLWKLALKAFTVDTLKKMISAEWHIPPEQLRIDIHPTIVGETQFRLGKDQTIVQPFG
jgi:hypothetical protein